MIKELIKQKSVIINGKSYIKRTELASIIGISIDKLKKLFEKDNRLRSSTIIQVEKNLRVAYVDTDIIEYLLKKLEIIPQQKTIHEKEVQTIEELKKETSKFIGVQLSLKDLDKINQLLHIIDGMLIILQNKIIKLETLKKDINELTLCYNSLVSRLKEIKDILKITARDFDILK